MLNCVLGHFASEEIRSRIVSLSEKWQQLKADIFILRLYQFFGNW